MDRHRHAAWKLPFGTLLANLSESPWTVSKDLTVKARAFTCQPERAPDGRATLSSMTTAEEIRLVVGQMWIIVREILFKGRHINVDAYLDDTKEIRLEDHDNW